ncbi:MAG: M20/M25/M40 family metallo-hydrolase [Verrucomicrobiales bacterium]|nr:M20/M25/M40 family metallo-hydrolase [Verrucomicrobiales bacterium]
MHHQTFVSLFRKILSTPTAPFHEYHVAAEIREQLATMPNVSVKEDAFGNLIACYRRGRKKPKLAFAAHMDHPGWVKFKGEEKFLGWVPEERLDTHPVEWFGDFGMWDLKPFELKDGIIHSRVCDDLVGCAAILAMFMELEAAEVEATVYGLFTRAEEVGFIGSVEMAKDWPLLESVCFVSLETSAARGGAEMGKGPAIRAGDRISVFHDATTAELVDAAAEGKIPHQRALLDGGACEATAMNLYGIPAAGISVILGNYHNCPPEKGIAEEFIALDDAKNLVKLITATAVRMSESKAADSSKAKLRKRLEKRVRDHRKYERAAKKCW